MSDIDIVVAAETQNVTLLRELLETRPRAINGKGYVCLNHLLFFAHSLFLFISFSFMEQKDNTVLIFAAEWGFVDMVSIIIEAGASLEIKNEVLINPIWRIIFYLQDGDTALIAASRKGYYDVCGKLIESGCEIDAQNKVLVL